MNKSGVVREIVSIVLGWSLGLVALTGGFLALVQFGHASAYGGVTCKCDCKDGAGKNVALAPDYMEPRPAIVHRTIRKSKKRTQIKAADTSTENESPVEYERATDDVPVVEEKPREDEIRDGVRYQAGHELMISPAPEVKDPGYPIEGSSAPDISPAPPTAPLPN